MVLITKSTFFYKLIWEWRFELLIHKYSLIITNHVTLLHHESRWYGPQKFSEESGFKNRNLVRFIVGFFIHAK